MAMTPRAPTIGRLSFPFYVGPDAALIKAASASADAVVVNGQGGPKVVAQLRRTNWEGTVLFDRAAYRTPDQVIGPERWFDDQARAGADRLVTPGRLLQWKNSPADLESEAEAELRVAQDHGATALFALDHRWLTSGLDTTLALFPQVETPIAVVLVHNDDPLSASGAVDGLIKVCKRTPNLSLFRIDHGGIGGLAFDAVHASLGLRSGHRHLVPPGSTGGGKRNDASVRLFCHEMMDWFTAMTVAEWAAAGFRSLCHLHCCNGEPLDRFFDPRRADEAALHNRVALAEMAMFIINAPSTDRRGLFALRCQEAIKRYDFLGFVGLRPKAQLSAWALWA